MSKSYNGQKVLFFTFIIIIMVKRKYKMDKKVQNDYIADIFQDFCEIESLTKILKDSVNNENKLFSMSDIENTLEILITKMTNTRISLNKYINNSF